jgi:ethanolaminephosphotransferase
VLPTQEHKLHVLILVAALFTLIPTVVSNAWSVSKKRPLLWTPLFTLLPFAVQVVFAVAWAKFSPAGILQLHPRLFIFGVGLIFCTNICKLMLAHLCALSYNPWRWSMAPFVIGALNGLLPRLFPGTPSPFDEETLFLVGIVWAFVSYAHFVFGVIRELTTILGIYCFTITRKQE